LPSCALNENSAQARSGFNSRAGNDFTHRFSLIVDELTRLRSRSCIIELNGGLIR
jgi:hypothetical protein